MQGSSPPRRACYAIGATQSGEKKKKGSHHVLQEDFSNCQKVGWLSSAYTQEAEHHFEPRSRSLEKSTCCPQGKHLRTELGDLFPLKPHSHQGQLSSRARNVSSTTSGACGGSKAHDSPPNVSVCLRLKEGGGLLLRGGRKV
ncbi:hypothetical protein CEXT_449941 [Caerostris extrusa]|uniref:Uncharacterized protein n=1 Tax=Caerostris extrusa TaxID=172846 RepID=A0AAV4MME2_CAEEX|nr:hypothetical protein CEXT_449941 [Caerostris extrusa]